MKLLRFFGSEVVLGTLIAILSVMTALSSYQGAMADSKQNEFEIGGMKNLNDGNASYLEANQFIVYDYSMYDGWYTTDDDEKADYYEENYSEQLIADLQVNPDNPFSEAYYNAMYQEAYGYWDESDTSFELAGQYDEKGDKLQLVMLLMALGLAFAAWASLLKEENNLRYLFALLSIVTLIVGLIAYTGVPAVAG
jgi:hypothetical protein